MNWFKKLVPSRINTEGRASRRSVPEGLWTKCPACDAVLYSTAICRPRNTTVPPHRT